MDQRPCPAFDCVPPCPLRVNSSPARHRIGTAEVPPEADGIAAAPRTVSACQELVSIAWLARAKRYKANALADVHDLPGPGAHHYSAPAQCAATPCAAGRGRSALRMC